MRWAATRRGLLERSKVVEAQTRMVLAGHQNEADVDADANANADADVDVEAAP